MNLWENNFAGEGLEVFDEMVESLWDVHFV